jgi:hypothetical protein
VRLRRQIVDFVRPNCLHELIERRAIGQVAINEIQPHVFFVRILIDVVDAPRIERRRSPDHAVDFVALREEQLGQIRAILARNAGHQRAFANLRRIG